MNELNLEAGLAELLARAAEGLHQAVTDSVFPRSQELVPRDTNALAESGKVSEPVIDGDTVTVVVSYGNQDDQTGIYAIVVHERLDIVHAAPTQAKYLEAAALEFAPDLVAQVAARMK